MMSVHTIQGRVIGEEDLHWLRAWIGEHSDWSRFRLAKELCKVWNWSSATGQLKDFAARTFLRKLMERGLISLPPVVKSMQRRHGFATPLQYDMQSIAPIVSIAASLSELLPLEFIIPEAVSHEQQHFHHYLSAHHYLGFNRTVGENMKYLIRDRYGRDIACVLFGAAAWKIIHRDRFIGWDSSVRSQRLSWIANNTRFLILPWVRVPHLASHILGRILRRIRVDWQAKYGHPIWLVETFVERERFAGICYKAANWKHIGSTKGRSRQDRYNALSVPVKDIYLYPLVKNFREKLCYENT
jgi:hypothetical protein